MTELKSQWGSLSPHLIAAFWAVDRQGKRMNDITVKAPFIDSNFEIALNWQSPFERVGEDVFPTLQQILQSGELSPLAQKIDARIGTGAGALLSMIEGKTSITKLNSTQVFNGMPPAKFNVTALFRAWSDPQKEVHDPFNQLMKWALPVKLSDDGTLLNRFLDNGVSVDTLFPSQAPTLIACKYKDCVYKPLVIESITKDTNAPIDKHGRFTELAVPMLLTTLSAIDR
ncbi:hypothetical protein, partial [Candidatus Methylomicrobium oryzae]|uniref:hypothetical protein n=1 Tax=Candidatus Methylomicrobium oryzae TaxID=2802053 RepID=UPI001923D957